MPDSVFFLSHVNLLSTAVGLPLLPGIERCGYSGNGTLYLLGEASVYRRIVNTMKAPQEKGDPSFLTSAVRTPG